MVRRPIHAFPDDITTSRSANGVPSQPFKSPHLGPGSSARHCLNTGEQEFSPTSQHLLSLSLSLSLSLILSTSYCSSSAGAFTSVLAGSNRPSALQCLYLVLPTPALSTSLETQELSNLIFPRDCVLLSRWLAPLAMDFDGLL